MTGKDILACDDRTYETVEIPEWNCALRVGTLSIRDRLQIEIAARPNSDSDSEAELQALIVGKSLYNGDGQRVFADADIEELANKSAVVLKRVVDVALRLNRMRAVDVETAQADFTAAR